MASEPRKLFISHASEDDTLVRALQQALAECGQPVWIDSRELRGGDPLWDTIRQAIEDVDALVVLVSPDGLQSKWLGMELKYALDLQRQRGKDRFAVIPLTLDDTRLGVLAGNFDEQPTCIGVRSGAVDAALDAVLVALRLKLPSDPESIPQPSAAPPEELVLELSDLNIQQDPDGKRRASAKARWCMSALTRPSPR